MTEAEDEVRAALDGWAHIAGEDVQWLADHEGEVEQPEEGRARQRYIADQRLLHVPLVLKAAERGDTWTALLHGMWLGLMSGFAQAKPSEYQALRQLRLQEPAVKTGRRVRAGASKGGSRRGRSPIILQRRNMILEKVSERHQRFPTKPFSEVTRQVAEATGMHPKSVQRIARGLKW